MTALKLKSTTVVVEVLVHVEIERPALDHERVQDAFDYATQAAKTNCAKPIADAVHSALQGKFTACRVAVSTRPQRVLSALAAFEEPPPT